MPTAKNTRADLTIALGVHQLEMWGFRMRGKNGVLEVVGQLALAILGRRGQSGRKMQPLSAERVEQIFKDWRKQERVRRHWTAGNGFPLPERWRFLRGYLVRSRPLRRGRPWGVKRYAAKLLKNGGVWHWAPFPDHYGIIPEPVLSPRAEKEYLIGPRTGDRRTSQVRKVEIV
jgi:hypothetical protein